MASTTDFEAWLESGNEPDGHEEVFSLWQAANGESSGIYEVTGDENKLFIKGPGEESLALVSHKAIQAFRRHIQKYKEDDDLDWEGSYEFRRAMEKDD